MEKMLNKCGSRAHKGKPECTARDAGVPPG